LIVITNPAPVAIITAPATAMTGAPVVVACASTDSNGTISSRAWTITPNSGFTGSLTGTGGTLTFTAPGTYTIGLTVTDNHGATNSTSRLIVITNPAPVAIITAPATAMTGAPVVVACASTDSNGTISSRAWTITPSSGFTGSLTGTGGTLTFTVPGTYTIGLTVTDNHGATNSTSRSIVITNPAPVAIITAPATAMTGAPVVVACASTDSNGTISSRAWTITPSSGFTGSLTGTGGTLTFTAPGTYTIGLTVTDNHGATNSTSRSIVITPAKRVILLRLDNVIRPPVGTLERLPVNYPQAIPVDINTGFVKDFRIETYGATQIRVFIENTSGQLQPFYLSGSDNRRTHYVATPVSGVTNLNFRLCPYVSENAILDVVIELISAQPTITERAIGNNALRVVGSLNDLRFRINLTR